MRRAPLLLIAIVGVALVLWCTGRSGGAPTPGPGVAPPRQTGPPPAVLAPPSPLHHFVGVVEQPELSAAEVDAALAAAHQFARRWARSGPTWHEHLAPLSTDALVKTLAAAAPPAPRAVRGSGRVVLGHRQWALVVVPLDDGELHLDLVRDKGRWLVARVDWQPT